MYNALHIDIIVLNFNEPVTFVYVCRVCVCVCVWSCVHVCVYVCLVIYYTDLTILFRVFLRKQKRLKDIRLVAGNFTEKLPKLGLVQLQFSIKLNTFCSSFS